MAASLPQLSANNVREPSSARLALQTSPHDLTTVLVFPILIRRHEYNVDAVRSPDGCYQGVVISRKLVAVNHSPSYSHFCHVPHLPSRSRLASYSTYCQLHLFSFL